MVDDNRTRIEQILSEVKQDVAARRAAGSYGTGYEESVESGHDSELGKTGLQRRDDLEALMDALTALRTDIARLSEVERDASKFAPLRYVRELAMTRHQMIRLNRDMKGIAEVIDDVARRIVETEEARSRAHEKIAQDLFDKVLERTAIIERMSVAYDELERRLNLLEKRNTP